MDFSLPIPTEEELNLGKKIEYYNRILDAELHKKYKLTTQEIADWIHHNYTAMFLLGEELSYNQYRKLNK